MGPGETNAFRKCGIYPYNESVFTEEDFVPSTVTDRPEPGQDIDETDAEIEIEKHDSHPTPPTSPSILVEEPSQQIRSPKFNSPQVELSQEVHNLITVNFEEIPQQQQASTSKFVNSFISPQNFRLPLKAGPGKIKKRSRPLGRSMIVTDTPEKDRRRRRLF
ncbi:unnamed protein product [Arctia plantaginis]|uniref:Uncharacterized protein n=1 Tax=Arctia plantaginis TaxID=874455 RepID=A0A8S0ZNJ8_ARCPL|nr:unnamed protein product [Arctia plantaginis]